MRPAWRIGATTGIVFGWLLVSPLANGAAPSTEILPGRSGPRLQAIATLSAIPVDSAPCLTPVLQTMRAERQRGTASVRRSLAALVNDPTLPSERTVIDADGSTVRFTSERSAFDRIDIADDNGNGRPDAVDEALSGIARAQRLLVGQLELPHPGAVEVTLGRLGSDVEGVSISPAGRQGRVHIWLDPSDAKGVSGLRRAAEHQYAHAVATAAGLDPAWGEAFSLWTAIALEGFPDDKTISFLAKRFSAQGAGLVVDDLDLASGNAAWFAFLEESYGRTAVKLAVEELGRGGSDQAALDRAMRRATGDTLDAALREYQVWSLLVGSRADGRHFSFATQLPGPTFAASADSLPALSIQSDPEIGPMGSALVQMRPGERNGGLTIRFEGDLAARWAADLLLVLDDGEMHRVPLPLDADDAGEISVPLQDLREVLLLVRNLDGEGRAARRYSWAAHFEPGFPTEFGTLRAEPAAGDVGAMVSWETSSERGLLGFNVLRARSDHGEAVRVNPVWIPSLGESGGPASYSFFDATAEPGVAYRYRVEAVTLEGLASRSEAVALTPAP